MSQNGSFRVPNIFVQSLTREKVTLGVSGKRMSDPEGQENRWRVVRFLRDGRKTSSSFFHSFSAYNCIRMARNFAKVFLQVVLKELSFIIFCVAIRVNSLKRGDYFSFD